jgi:hypothetical protein
VAGISFEIGTSIEQYFQGRFATPEIYNEHSHLYFALIAPWEKDIPKALFPSHVMKEQ